MNRELQEAQSSAMVIGFRAGRGNKEISDFNAIPLKTVKSFKKVWNSYLANNGDPDKFDVKRKTHKRPSDGYQQDKVDLIKGRIYGHPDCCIRTVASEMNI